MPKNAAAGIVKYKTGVGTKNEHANSTMKPANISTDTHASE
jgi:hypothetical protein